MFCRSLNRIICGYFCCFVLVSPAISASPNDGVQVHDVVLNQRGELQGQVVSADGRPVADRLIAARTGTDQPLVVKSEDSGLFHIPVRETGVYQVAANDQTVVIRCWAADIAPPHAKSGLMLVVDETVRGQCDTCPPYGAPVSCDPCQKRNRIGAWLCNPCVIGLGIAAAIAIPVALDNDDDNGNGHGGEGEPSS